MIVKKSIVHSIYIYNQVTLSFYVLMRLTRRVGRSRPHGCGRGELGAGLEWRLFPHRAKLCDGQTSSPFRCTLMHFPPAAMAPIGYDK
jgi:hypothetical protein